MPPVDANTSDEAPSEPYQKQEPQLYQVIADLIYAIDDKIHLAEEADSTGRDALLLQEKRDKLKQKLDSFQAHKMTSIREESEQNEKLTKSKSRNLTK